MIPADLLAEWEEYEVNAIPWIDDLPKDEVVAIALAIARDEHEELGALKVLHEIDQTEIDRLRAELASHCACVFELASQEGGCDLVERCDFHASEEEYLVLPLRAEIERLKSDLSGVTDECANLLKIKAKLWAEVERLKGCVFTNEFIAGVEWRTCRICGERHRRDAMSHGNLCPAREAGEEPRRFRCACGWSGTPSGMKATPGGGLACPDCGGTGGIIGEEPR